MNGFYACIISSKHGLFHSITNVHITFCQFQLCFDGKAAESYMGGLSRK